MKSIETQAKTVDQAIELGLYKLGTTRDKVKISILEQAGLFNKARVKLTLAGEESESENALKELVEGLINAAKLNVQVNVEEQEEALVVDLTGEDSAVVIGKHGDSLEAFQFLINTIFNKGKKHDDYKRVIVDSSNYRSKREATLKVLAERTAVRATRENRDIRLEPMSANERRIIHSALANNGKVTTESQGKEPNRYVVVKLVNKKNKQETTTTENREYND